MMKGLPVSIDGIEVVIFTAHYWKRKFSDTGNGVVNLWLSVNIQFSALMNFSKFIFILSRFQLKS
jgi:hypothetical protein